MVLGVLLDDLKVTLLQEGPDHPGAALTGRGPFRARGYGENFIFERSDGGVSGQLKIVRAILLPWMVQGAERSAKHAPPRVQK